MQLRSSKDRGVGRHSSERSRQAAAAVAGHDKEVHEAAMTLFLAKFSGSTGVQGAEKRIYAEVSTGLLSRTRAQLALSCRLHRMCLFAIQQYMQPFSSTFSEQATCHILSPGYLLTTGESFAPQVGQPESQQQQA